MVTENWKPIEGWPGYEVSDYGNVRSFKRSPRNPHGEAYPIKGSVDKWGYGTVVLVRQNPATGKRELKCLFRHRLVAQAFIPNDDPINKTLVLHRLSLSWGGTNHATNLRWGTAKDNYNDSVEDGKRPRKGGHV